MESPRINLRRFRLSDLANMIELETDPEIMKFTPTRVPLPPQKIEERLQSLVDRGKNLAPLGVWAAELKDTRDFVGWFMLMETGKESPELGFMIARRHWGKGYATEAGSRLLQHGFQELQLETIAATTDQDNTACKRVLARLGFQCKKTISIPDKILEKGVSLDVFELRKT